MFAVGKLYAGHGGIVKVPKKSSVIVIAGIFNPTTQNPPVKLMLNCSLYEIVPSKVTEDFGVSMLLTIELIASTTLVLLDVASAARSPTSVRLPVRFDYALVIYLHSLFC